MGKNNIEKFSWGYYFLKAYGRVVHYFYYGRIRIKGRENIPFGEPIIFAPNHQNALMDAMAILFTVPRQPVFLARSDIFKKPIFAKILTFLKIMPVYRIRDGYASLQNNQDTFDRTINVLKSESPLVILPEGNHAGFRKLRQLKKGIARIAFQAEEANDFDLGIKIVPVGIDYSRYERSGSELLITYGKPINVSDFAETYKEKDVTGINALMAEIREKLSKLMIDIQKDDDHYETYDIMRKSYAYSLLKKRNIDNSPWDRHKLEIETVDLLNKIDQEEKDDGQFITLGKHAKNYDKILKENKLHYRNAEEGPKSIFSLLFQGIVFLALCPLYLYGYLNNILPFWFIKLVATKIKDIQFISTFKFGLSILAFPIFYLIQSIIFAFVQPWGWEWTLIYILALPLSGLIFARYRLYFKRYQARWRFKLIQLFRKGTYYKMMDHRMKMDELMDMLA